MKFLCVQCDEPMLWAETQGPVEGSLSLFFVCPRCGHKIALLTNPGETQLVKALDVKIGSPPPPPSPMKLLRSTLAQQHPLSPPPTPSIELLWTEAAQKRLERLPPFAREMVRQGVERYAQEKGYREITPQVIDEAKGELGSLFSFHKTPFPPE